MKLHELEKSPEAKASKRVGRGPGSGLGKTSGRGQKGQKSRSGSSIPVWFRGGEMPLHRRIPKRGFNNKRFKTEYAIVNISDLNIFKDGDKVTPEKLIKARIIKKELDGIKILGNGNLEKKLTVKAHKFTESATQKIQNAGGTVEVI